MNPWEKVNEISISKYNARFDDCNSEQRKEVLLEFIENN